MVVLWIIKTRQFEMIVDEQKVPDVDRGNTETMYNRRRRNVEVLSAKFVRIRSRCLQVPQCDAGTHFSVFSGDVRVSFYDTYA